MATMLASRCPPSGHADQKHCGQVGLAAFMGTLSFLFSKSGPVSLPSWDASGEAFERPMVLAQLQVAARTNSRDAHSQFATLRTTLLVKASSVRSRLVFSTCAVSQRESEIAKRFCTGAWLTPPSPSRRTVLLTSPGSVLVGFPTRVMAARMSVDRPGLQFKARV